MGIKSLPNPVLEILWDIWHEILGEDHGAGDAGVEEHHKEEPEEADVPEGLAVAVLRTANVRIQIRSLLEGFTWLLEVYSSLGSDIYPDM